MKNLKTIVLSFFFTIAFLLPLQASDSYIAGLRIYVKQDCAGCVLGVKFMENAECYILEWDANGIGGIKAGSQYVRAPSNWCRGLKDPTHSRGNPNRKDTLKNLENIFEKYGFDSSAKYAPKENVNLNIKLKSPPPYPHYKIGNHSWDRFIYECDKPEEIVKAFHMDPDKVICEIQECDSASGCKKLVFKEHPNLSNESPPIQEKAATNEISSIVALGPTGGPVDMMPPVKTPKNTKIEKPQVEKKSLGTTPGPSPDIAITPPGGVSGKGYDLNVNDDTPREDGAVNPEADFGTDNGIIGKIKKKLEKVYPETVATNILIYIFIAISLLFIIVITAYLNKKNKAFIDGRLSQITNKINKTESEFDGKQITTLNRELSVLSESLNKYSEKLSKISVEDALELPQGLTNELHHNISQSLADEMRPIINIGMETVFHDFFQRADQNIDEAINPLNKRLDSFGADIESVQSNVHAISEFISGLTENVVSGIARQSVKDKKEAIEAVDPLIADSIVSHQFFNDKILTLSEQISTLSDIIKKRLPKNMIPAVSDQFNKDKKEIIDTIPILVKDIEKQFENIFLKAEEKIEEKIEGKLESIEAFNDEISVADTTEKIKMGAFNFDSDAWKSGLLRSYSLLQEKKDVKSQFCLFLLDMCHFRNIVSMLFDHNYMTKILKASQEENMNSYLNILNDYSSHRISVKMLPTLVYIINSMLCPIAQNQSHPIFSIYKDLSYINNMFLLASKNLGIIFHHIPPQANFLACGDHMERSPKVSILIHQIIRSEEKYVDIFREWIESFKPLNSGQDIVIDVVNLGYNFEGQEEPAEKSIVTTYHDIEGKF